MKRDIGIWQFGGFVLTALLGTLLHFIYDWTGKSVFVAPFSAINESTWEHIKLAFFPMFVFALVQSRFFDGFENFWCVKLSGILTALLLIPALFYAYNGAIGRSPDFVNIAIFFVATAIAFVVESRLFKSENFGCGYPWLAFAVICLIGVLFVLFTFLPPQIPLFEFPGT